MECLNKSKELILEGQLKKALLMLLTCVKENFPSKEAAVNQQLSSFNELRKDYADDQITDEEFRVGKSRIRKRILELIADLLTGSIQTSDKKEEKIQLRAYHQHTCDRVEQQNEFLSSFDIEPNKKIHFYYVTGEEEQSHFGFVSRIAHDRGGYLLDIDNPDLQTSKLLIEEIILESYSSSDNLKKDFLRKLLANVNIPVNTYKPILDKRLDFVCNNSPIIKNLKQTDFVCILVSIYEDEWDEDESPKLIRWFIESFCDVELDKDLPTFLFFFGVIYDEGTSEVKNSVANVVKNSSLVKDEIIKPLPELSMVSKSHLNSWFRKYKIIAPNKQSRKALIDKHFSNGEEFDMETVEIELKKIIDAFNKSE